VLFVGFKQNSFLSLVESWVFMQNLFRRGTFCFLVLWKYLLNDFVLSIAQVTST